MTADDESTREQLLENINNKLRALFPDGAPDAAEKRAEVLAFAAEHGLGPPGVRDVAHLYAVLARREVVEENGRNADVAAVYRYARRRGRGRHNERRALVAVRRVLGLDLGRGVRPGRGGRGRGRGSPYRSVASYATRLSNIRRK